MPLFALTERLRSELSRGLEKGLPERADMYRSALERGEVSLDCVLALQRDLKEFGVSHVHELLRGASIIAPVSKKSFQQSPNTKAKFEQYRRELENKAYAKMVKNVTQPEEEVERGFFFGFFFVLTCFCFRTVIEIEERSSRFATSSALLLISSSRVLRCLSLDGG